MARYIDADKLIENLKKQYGEDLGWQCTVNMSDVEMMIEDAPTADVVEVKHGEWKESKFVYGGNMTKVPLEYVCSLCDKGVYFEKTNYCPNCGADMRGETDGKVQK